MTKGDIIGFIFMSAFALGWLNLFDDPRLTWWGVIYYLGNL